VSDLWQEYTSTAGYWRRNKGESLCQENHRLSGFFRVREIVNLFTQQDVHGVLFRSGKELVFFYPGYCTEVLAGLGYGKYTDGNQKGRYYFIFVRHFVSP